MRTSFVIIHGFSEHYLFAYECGGVDSESAIVGRYVTLRALLAFRQTGDSELPLLYKMHYRCAPANSGRHRRA